MSEKQGKPKTKHSKDESVEREDKGSENSNGNSKSANAGVGKSVSVDTHSTVTSKKKVDDSIRNAPKNASSSRPKKDDILEDYKAAHYPRSRERAPRHHIRNVKGNSGQIGSNMYIPKTDPNRSFTDDSRFSKYIRRITKDPDKERRFTCCCHLLDYLRTPEGVKTVKKGADDALTALHEVFYERVPRELKTDVSRCIGMIGWIMGQDSQSYFQWLFEQTNRMIEDDVRSLYVDSLLETLRLDEKKQLDKEMMTMVMINVQTLLENADSSILLKSVVNVILRVAKHYPHIFSSHFRDTVDILVGWHIDATQQESVIDFTSTALIALHQFWAEDLSFSATLLGQFLEDMEAYADDIQYSKDGKKSTVEDLASNEDCILKITALLKVFTTVVKSLGRDLNLQHSRYITQDYMNKILNRISRSIQSTTRIYYSERLIIEANKCLTLLMDCLGDAVVHSSDAVTEYTIMLLFEDQLPTAKTIHSIIDTFHKMIDIFGIQLPVPIVRKLLSPGTTLQKHRFSSNEQTLQKMMILYHHLMALKSVSILQEAYSLVVGDLQQAFNTLTSDSNKVVKVSEENAYSEVQYTVKQAEAVCVFNLCALAEIGNTKNNLVAIWALTPSIFDLLSNYFSPSDSTVIEKYPAVQYALMNTLFSHCTRHGHFVSSSSLIMQSSNTEGSLLANVKSSTAENFTRILQLLSKLLDEHLVSHDCRCISLKWILDLVDSLQSNPYVFCAEEFCNLIKKVIQLGHSLEIKNSRAVCMCLKKIYSLSINMPTSLVERSLKLGISRLIDSRKSIEKVYFSLLEVLPFDVTNRAPSLLHLCDDNNVTSQEGVEEIMSLWLAKRAYMANSQSSGFQANNFSQIMSFVMHGNIPKQSRSLNWLEAMFSTSHYKDKSDKDGTKIEDYIVNNEALLWFWATWESAQYCITNRLRTPLGKPQETFTTIERVLKKYAAEMMQDTEEDHKEESEPEKQLRVLLLLQFIEHLERLLYNSYEGCAIALPPTQKLVRTFFRTNKGTCAEWLSRIRRMVIDVAVGYGLPTLAVRHCQASLKDLKDNNNLNSGDFEHVVLMMVRALSELRQPDAISGLYHWYQNLTGNSGTWIKVAVLKAQQRYETAAQDYKTLLNTMMSDGIDSDETSRESLPFAQENKNTTEANKSTAAKNRLNFIVNEISDCYQLLGDWDSVIEWQDTVTDMKKKNNQISLNVDINYIKALACFDDEEYLGTIEHLKSCFVKSNIPCTDVWSSASKMDFLSLKFIQLISMLQFTGQNDNKHEMFEILHEMEEYAKSSVKMQSLEWPIARIQKNHMHIASIALLQRKVSNQEIGGRFSILTNDLKLDEEEHDIDTFLQLLRLLQIQTDITEGSYEQLLQFQLLATKLARKQSNFQLSEQLLLFHIDTLHRRSSEVSPLSDNETLLYTLFSLRSVVGQDYSEDILQVEREGAKFLHSTNHYKESIQLLSNSIVHAMDETSLSVKCRELCSRSLLTLVKWIQADQKMLSNLVKTIHQSESREETVYVSTANNLKLLLELEERGYCQQSGSGMEEKETDLKLERNPVLGETDYVIGQLLHLSTIESPKLSKSWFSLANWCYKWGRKSVDSASHGSIELLPEETALVLDILPKMSSSEEKSQVLQILSRIHSLENSEEDIAEQDQDAYDDSAETTIRQLLSTTLSLQMDQEEIVDKLLTVWRGVVNRIYNYYLVSAKAFFTFLQLNGATTAGKEDDNIISTLRLLRLLVKHAWELRNVLEKGLAKTPTKPWKGIIPQLFSRLSHPELYVRQSILDLLCRVANDTPHLIVYPAVVGSSATFEGQNREGLLNRYLSKQLKENCDADQEEDAKDNEYAEDKSDTMLQNCLTSLVDTLSDSNPRMILEVKDLVHELRRITLLWDELWLGTLNQQQQDVSKKLQQLELEVKKVTNNASLSKDEKTAIILEKHRAIMKPTLYTLERLQEITSQEPETPHESFFQEMYGSVIDAAIERLKTPPNPSQPSSSWQPFKQMHASLQQRAQKRSSLILKMDKISPKLDSLESSMIPMPGLGITGKAVTIESVFNVAQILPTKTKPKKLAVLGSDGKRYPYLFKGLEDLHLDERIMQFLNIVNNMFGNVQYNGAFEKFRARHYSVTPLGLRSGLIQWVEGATPLFSLYKKWQQRETLSQLPKTSSTGGNQQQLTIPRPSEVFYDKLTPALKEKGISNLDNRKEWPLHILRGVLQDLIAETPADLLSRELWCSSTGPNEWWNILQSYSRSCAVMSMIGYIIGLGDRHLDNVLIDLATGEVVHIDYNVCFEKGKALRVPEKVPFRLTQNIETALGITGIEGIFRNACEYVIKTMRKGKETLLTLLEAFVYDPLVDWTTGNDGGYTGAFYGGGGLSVLAVGGDNRQTKEDMEKEITRSMFSIRMTEMKFQWIKNRDEMMEIIPKLEGSLGEWINSMDVMEKTNSQMTKIKKLLILLEETTNSSSSQLNSLEERFMEYQRERETKNAVLALLQEKIDEYCHWQSMHKHAIQSIQEVPFQKMCVDVSKNLILGSPSFSTATEFLQGAGQAQVILQCEQLESEMVTFLQYQRSHLHHAIDVLHTYGTIIGKYDIYFCNKNRTTTFLGWLQELVCDLSTSRCQQIMDNFHSVYGSQGKTTNKTQHVLVTEAKLQTAISEINSRLFKSVDRKRQEQMDTIILEEQVQEQKQSVQIFIQENGMSGVSSLLAWIISALCSLNKRYNQMEAAAAGAGEQLLDLTSRDGDWFLDELCSMSSNIMHYIDILKFNASVQDLDHFPSLYSALKSSHAVYVALQDMYMNFRTIILPESIKVIQAQELSVCQALEKLDTIIGETGHSIETIMMQMELLHRNAMMGINSDNGGMMILVNKLELRYQELLESEGQDELSPGQMVMMGFNGLFCRLDQEFSNLIDSVDNLGVPEVWKKVDAVREGKSMQLSSFSFNARQYLKSIFFIKRLQTMQQFFKMCTELTLSIQGMEGRNYYDDNQLSRPLKQFIADYVRKQVLGFPSQILGYILCTFIDALGVDVTAEIEVKDVGAESKVPLEDLRKKAVDICLRSEQFQHLHLTQCSTLISSLDATWRRNDLSRRLDINIELLKSSLQRYQLQLARLQWLHEDEFIASGYYPSQMVQPDRSSVLSEMRKSMQALLDQEEAMENCHNIYVQLENSIVQRLKWAAGANPSLNLVMQQFEEASKYRNRIYQEELKCNTEVVSLCQGILHLEALRTNTEEAISCDTDFLATIHKCMESCNIIEMSQSTVTDLEVLLLTLKPLEENQSIDMNWMVDSKMKVLEHKQRLKETLNDFKNSIEASKAEVKSTLTSLKEALTFHHRLMSDIRTILKSMAKQEEHEFGDEPVAGGVKEYLTLYKNFSEKLTSTMRSLQQEDSTMLIMKEAHQDLNSLKLEISQIFDNLVSLAPPLIAKKEEKSPVEVTSPALKSLLDSPTRKQKGIVAPLYPSVPNKAAGLGTKKPEKVARDPRTGKAIQERNTYAVSVWRRVKMKLDGRDPDLNKRLSVHEQVDFVIQEAKSMDNLAVLYEGWTPWV